ncbi:Uncharacterised protein [Raoultella terrigena]|uniref:Uncharacterized protein n=1 Tax=Raoultella terrigena TaxID=577 RepID=A0A4U9D253_RAOTE|nr:Uncharacterised protein [Raoultella terrigena]
MSNNKKTQASYRLSHLVLTSFVQWQPLRLLKQGSPQRRSKLPLKRRAKNSLIYVLRFSPFLMLL